MLWMFFLWRFKVLFSENIFLQMSHSNLTFRWTDCWWSNKVFLNENFLSHLSQKCSILWWIASMCSLRVATEVKLFKQSSQLNFTFSWATFTWLLRLCLEAKFLSHRSHSNLWRFPECLAFLWAFRWWASLKHWSHKSHSCFRFSVWQFLLCLMYDDFTEKEAGQCSHLICLWFLWTPSIWIFKLAFVVNFFLHKSHWNFTSWCLFQAVI